MRGEDLIKVFFLPDVDIEERRALATDELDAIDGLFGGIEKVVHDHHFVVSFKQCESCE